MNLFWRKTAGLLLILCVIMSSLGCVSVLDNISLNESLLSQLSSQEERNESSAAQNSSIQELSSAPTENDSSTADSSIPEEPKFYKSEPGSRKRNTGSALGIEREDTDENSKEEENSQSGESSEDESRDESSGSQSPDEMFSDDSSTRYLIRVNKSTNVVTIYAKDSEGNHTVPVKAMICSCGEKTPTGTFMMGYQARWNGLEGNQWGQYVSHITGDFLFHSIPCRWRGEDGTVVKYYNQLGTTASAGCVRLTCGDAYWIYMNCDQYNTLIQLGFFGDTDPLGKPSFMRLPTDSETNWDPTDPAYANPWNSRAPYFTGVQDFSLEVGNEIPNLMQGVKGYDTCGNDITYAVQVSGSVNRYQAGTYAITYSVTDLLGRTGYRTAYVTVHDPKPEESGSEESSDEESREESSDSGHEESSEEDSSESSSEESDGVTQPSESSEEFSVPETSDSGSSESSIE